MKKINLKINTLAIIVLSGIIFTSCNKSLVELAPIATPVYPSSTTTISKSIAANPNDSLFNRLLIRSGLNVTLNDTTKTFTVFAVDNVGMKIFVNAATGGFIPLTAPDADFSKFISGTYPVTAVNLSATQAVGIAMYSIVGQKYPSSAIGTAFPNFPLPTQIQLDPVNSPFLRLTSFPTKSTPFSYVNNVPLTGIDQLASNGVIHHTYSVVAPPSALLKSVIASKANLSYFRAAVARGDSGSVGTSRFDSLFNYGIMNMTVLAPNDAAMQPVLFGALYQGLIFQGVPAGTAFTQATLLSATPAGFNYLPVADVKGIVAYHILASNPSGNYVPNIRVFSVNTPSTATFIKTLVNTGVAAHPGVRAQATFTGSVASTVTFSGAGTFPPGGTPYSQIATVTEKDLHAVNGVLHIIDKVLLPQ
ncbi:MAG: fasciclin domain-containing protein [Ferruginibacter sp.]|nr:fasciclin domain-containing protein [Ferruginibacter sp.]